MKPKLKLVSTGTYINFFTGAAAVWAWCPETSKLYMIGVLRD